MKLDLKSLLLFLGIIATKAADPDAVTAPTVQFKPHQTAGNAQNVSQGFIGFAIEMSSFPQYGGKLPHTCTRIPSALLNHKQE
jgi:hypothetical protein